jgi:hypothetical protein
MFGEGERLPAAVIEEAVARQHAAVFEAGEQLRDGSRGHRCAAGELGADNLSFADRLKDKVLGDCQRWVVGGE